MTGKPRKKKRRDALRGDGAIVRANVAPRTGGARYRTGGEDPTAPAPLPTVLSEP